MFELKVGVMPGRVQEVAVERATVKEVIAMVELDPTGYEVRVNGTAITNLDTEVTANGTILLVKQVKGNSDMRMIKVGVMPGRISEIAIENGATVEDALCVAELDATGYEIRLNGTTVGQDATITTDGTLLLVKQVKGNGSYKIGVMPGRINELAIEDGTSVKGVLEMAELDATGYEIRLNGTTVGQDAQVVGDGTLLLVKQVKGNK